MYLYILISNNEKNEYEQCKQYETKQWIIN